MSDPDATQAPGPAPAETPRGAVSPSSQLVKREGEIGNATDSAAPEVLARPAGFPQLTPPGAAPDGTPLDSLLDVTVSVTAELGQTTLCLGDVLKLGVGSVVELDRFVGEPVSLSVKGVLLAQGEVVVVGDRFAVRIKEILKPKQGAGEKRA